MYERASASKAASPAEVIEAAPSAQTLAPTIAPRSGALSGPSSTIVLRRLALESAGTLERPGFESRVHGATASPRPATSPIDGGPIGRIRRSPSSPPATGASTGTRVQPMSHGDVIQRDFVGAMKSAGRGIRSAAKATGKFVENSAIAVKDAAVTVAEKIHRSDFNDLNATQYLVSAGGQIEAINRREEDGVVVYYRTGSVTVGDGDRPTIDPYDPPVAMPDGWLPTVTHINGMMVKPNSGLGSAIKLQQELEKAGGGGALLGADVPSVLYTYSAHRGFVTDLAECIWGKLYQDDDATDRQTQIMLDAVTNQHRTTVSAHSRGTIKTDNAVRNAHGEISRGMVEMAMVDPAVIKQAKDTARLVATSNPELGLSASMLEPVYVRLFAREQADRLATAELDKYVHLIYAGNAVQFPSASVNLNLVVAGKDPVTIGVGKFFGFAKGKKTKMTDVAGGHGFNENYAATVAQLIIADLEAQQPK